MGKTGDLRMGNVRDQVNSILQPVAASELQGEQNAPGLVASRHQSPWCGKLGTYWLARLWKINRRTVE